jgi:BirA family transcriptional regulator, biotin operon repressor / biotin---[acetyl-CoA-carboxylase] ligase
MRGILLDASVVRAACAGGLWTSVDVVGRTGSTNADLLARGGPEGQVLVAEEQTAGRGRMGRTWVSQPGASLTFSVLLRPTQIPPVRRGWLPLLTGIAVATAVRSAAGVAATLKWPNDVLIGEAKLAGILAEQSGGAVVIGIGINVATSRAALPVSPSGVPATSLRLQGAAVARDALLIEVLRQFERIYMPFRADPDPVRTGLLASYRTLCTTLGSVVRVEFPGGSSMEGVAEDVDGDGRLLVREADATTPIAAGDVIHVR